MAGGKRKDEWSRWAHWMCLFANANRDPKKGKAFKPKDFDPYALRAASGAKPPTPEEQVALFSLAVGAKKQE